MSKMLIETNIIKNPEIFENLVLSPKKSVVCNNQGEFYEENCLKALIRKIACTIFGDFFGFISHKHIGWARGLVFTFDQFEQSRFEVNPDKYKSYLKTAKTVKAILKKNRSANVQKELRILKERTVALKYRLGAAYSAKYERQPQVDMKLFEDLKPLITAWKKTHIIFKSHELSEEKEINQVRILTQYPKFASLVRDHTPLRVKFFEWAILAKNPVDEFVQFPRTIEKLIDNCLFEKIGRYGGQDLKLEKKVIEGKIYKDLTLPFEGTRESILDEKHVVTLAHNYRLSIAEIYKIFRDRIKKVGNLEYFGEGKGICNWNANEWGALNPAINDYVRIDVNDPDWIKKVPFSEKITEEEAKMRFEDKDGQKLKFERHHFIFTALAKSETQQADLLGAHTTLCIAVPLDDGTRGLCYLSKFAREFPDFNTEKKRYVRMGFDTVEAAIQLPDENFFQIKRDEEAVSWVASEEQARVVLQRISKDKLKSMKGSLYYQILVYNCTDWVFKKLRDVVLEAERDAIAALHVWDAKPEGLSGKFIKLPKRVRELICNLSIKIAKPQGKIKICKNGTEKEIKLTIENAPWKKPKIKKLHPTQIILEKRKRVEAWKARLSALGQA
jgi:hypothetical protein